MKVSINPRLLCLNMPKHHQILTRQQSIDSIPSINCSFARHFLGKMAIQTAHDCSPRLAQAR